MCFTHLPGDDTVTGDGWLAAWWEGSFLTPQQPSVFDLPKVLAVGIASPAAAAINRSLWRCRHPDWTSLICCIRHRSGRLPKGLPGTRPRRSNYHTGRLSKKVFITKRL